MRLPWPGIGQTPPNSSVSLPTANGAMAKPCGNLPMSISPPEKPIAITLTARARSRHENQGVAGHRRVEWVYSEHPFTAISTESEVHANHNEAQNSALRRRCSAYRRRQHLYAKKVFKDYNAC